MKLFPSSHSAISEWFFHGVPNCDELRKKCKATQDGNTKNLFITCDDEESAEQARNSFESISIKARDLNAPIVRIQVNGKPDSAYIFLPDVVLTHLRRSTAVRIPDAVITVPGVKNSNSIGVVRMKDNVGLLCSNLEMHSAASDNDWLGKDMSAYHFPAELKRLTDALEKHGEISEFSYQALDFNFAKKAIVVNASFALYRGDFCRFVTVLHSELI